MYPDAMHQGFGVSPRQDLEEIRKALTTGYGLINQTNGDALRVQSLEGTLKVLTYTSKNLKLFPQINKSQAYNTVEEYNQLVSYGTRTGGFVRAGELPRSSDSSIVRRTAFVKFCGTTREVDHPMTLVNPAHGDVIALQNHNGVLWLMERIEDALFHADSSLAFSGESEMWDGLDAAVDAASYLDMQNQPVVESDMEEAANIIADNNGVATDIYWGFKPGSDFMRIFYPRERINLPVSPDGKAGVSIRSFISQFGEIGFNPDRFLQPLPSPPSAATDPYAPNTPSAFSSSGFSAANSAEWTKLVGTPTAATAFSYAVTACNRFGESAPLIFNASLTVAAAVANQAILLSITTAAVIGANPPEFYKIYRTRPGVTSTDPADFSHILSVPTTTQVAATAMVDITMDRNFLIPFTHMAYMGEMTEQVLTFRQLAPLTKMDLAVVAPAYRWIILLYGTPILFAPRKWLRLINIGEL